MLLNLFKIEIVLSINNFTFYFCLNYLCRHHCCYLLQLFLLLQFCYQLVALHFYQFSLFSPFLLIFHPLQNCLSPFLFYFECLLFSFLLSFLILSLHVLQRLLDFSFFSCFDLLPLVLQLLNENLCIF